MQLQFPADSDGEAVRQGDAAHQRDRAGRESGWEGARCRQPGQLWWGKPESLKSRCVALVETLLGTQEEHRRCRGRDGEADAESEQRSGLEADGRRERCPPTLSAGGLQRGRLFTGTGERAQRVGEGGHA